MKEKISPDIWDNSNKRFLLSTHQVLKDKKNSSKTPLTLISSKFSPAQRKAENKKIFITQKIQDIFNIIFFRLLKQSIGNIITIINTHQSWWGFHLGNPYYVEAVLDKAAIIFLI